MRIRDLHEAIDGVTKVYCPHTIQLTSTARNIDALLKVTHLTSQPMVELSYGAPAKIDAGNFPRLFLMMHCARGHASTSKDNQRAEWHHEQTMPFSAGFDTQLWFDGACSTGCGQAGGTVHALAWSSADENVIAPLLHSSALAPERLR
jgi:hypothetical protein